MMLALLGAEWPRLRTYLRPLRADALASRPLARLLRVGAPVGGQQWLEFGVFGAAGLLMGLLGTVAGAQEKPAEPQALHQFLAHPKLGRRPGAPA